MNLQSGTRNRFQHLVQIKRKNGPELRLDEWFPVLQKHDHSAYHSLWLTTIRALTVYAATAYWWRILPSRSTCSGTGSCFAQISDCCLLWRNNDTPEKCSTYRIHIMEKFNVILWKYISYFVSLLILLLEIQPYRVTGQRQYCKPTNIMSSARH